MLDIPAMLQQGTATWLFVPSAILLGALHGLEPGHSKTMMAAFIIAIRGSIAQAVMLGLAATLSHTAVVWAIALIGLHFGSQWNNEATEPYLQLAASVIIIGVALWMLWRTARPRLADRHSHVHAATRLIDTGHGVLRLELFEAGAPARFRLHPQDEAASRWLSPALVSLQTERPDGAVQSCRFERRDAWLESLDAIAEPHEFIVRVRLGHDDHSHDYDLEFTEHGHAHAIGDYAGLDVSAPGYQDPHELAHANDIRHRFARRQVSNGQILLFGLTGGLLPCPASITVLMLCLQLKQLTLGALLVLCFSVGLALTLVFSGIIAAVSVRHAARHWSGFGELARRAPYLSGALILLVGLYVGYQGLHHILD